MRFFPAGAQCCIVVPKLILFITDAACDGGLNIIPFGIVGSATRTSLSECLETELACCAQRVILSASNGTSMPEKATSQRMETPKAARQGICEPLAFSYELSIFNSERLRSSDWTFLIQYINSLLLLFFFLEFFCSVFLSHRLQFFEWAQRVNRTLKWPF